LGVIRAVPQAVASLISGQAPLPAGMFFAILRPPPPHLNSKPFARLIHRLAAATQPLPNLLHSQSILLVHLFQSV
jgi:hypothetical protein